VARTIYKTEFHRPIAQTALIAFGMIVTLAVAAQGCSHVVPSHEIRPKPEFIRVGVQVGDSVEITTIDGKYREFVVEDVGTDTIEGPDETIRFSEIQSVVKRSWKEPAHPCGGGIPVGCSIPEVVLILSEDYEQQAEKFHPACVKHDFCYRHGFATYGATREECDTVIYEDMKKACGGMGGLGVLDVKEFGICQFAANQTFEAVRRHGEKHFRTTTSTYCEYREDP
jgi:hypothetical protein